MYKGTTAQCVNVCGALSAGQRDVGVFSACVQRDCVSVGVSDCVRGASVGAVWGDIIKHASFFQIRTCFMLASWLFCLLVSLLLPYFGG